MAHDHKKQHSQTWYLDPNAKTVIKMMGLTGTVMVVELVVGIITQSLALFADAMHMLSDISSLVVGLWCIRLSKKPSSDRMSYGYERAEVIGGFFNAIFLFSMTVFLFTEVVHRFIDIEEIKNPDLVLLVGGVGLAVNILGLVLFRHHGHGHGGHSHGGHSHGHDHHDHTHKPQRDMELGEKSSTPFNLDATTTSSEATSLDELSEMDLRTTVSDKVDPLRAKKKRKRARNVNMEGMFLHILGDFLGSIVVMISASVMKWSSWDKRFYIDPVCTLAIIAIILWTTLPLVKKTARVLMQAVPGHISIVAVKKELLQVKGLIAIHDMHVWQLVNNKLIATMHVVVDDNADFSAIALKLKHVFHDRGIHNSTIQPEFVDPTKAGLNVHLCQFICSTDCMTDWCCPPSEKEAQARLQEKETRAPDADKDVVAFGATDLAKDLPTEDASSDEITADVSVLVDEADIKVVT